MSLEIDRPGLDPRDELLRRGALDHDGADFLENGGPWRRCPQRDGR